MNREGWLQDAVAALGPLFREHANLGLPEVHVSAGWPSRGGMSAKRKVLGECWPPSVSEDGRSAIFLNPMLGDSAEILGVLVHELIHALHPEAKHRGDFVTTAKAMGLTGPWASTNVGPELAPRLAAIVADLGEYPHSKMNPLMEGRRPQSTRMKKVSCSSCGYIVRTTEKWLNVAVPNCPDLDCDNFGLEMEVA